MPQIQTVETDASVEAFLNRVENPVQRQDSHALLDVMRKSTEAEPKMWGPAIVGFGKYQYQYANGKTGEMPRVGFSPRKGKIVLYLCMKNEETESLLEKLGKYKRSGGCIYISKMRDVDPVALANVVKQAWALTQEQPVVRLADLRPQAQRKAR
jgi:hypothetical protein